MPSKEKFYCSLTDKLFFSDKEYEHVLNAWKKFEMKTMKDYHDMYLKFDILLLADVLEKFRNNSLENYGLCPSHYLIAPGLSLDVMLKMTKIKLEPIPDPDMYIFIEKGTWGVTAYISNRYSKAKNKCLKSHDPKQESKQIIYLPNNLYCYTMSKFLATNGCKWINPK